MIGDNKPSLTGLLSHIDRIGNFGADLREFMKSEGESIVAHWATIEPVLDNHIKTMEGHVEEDKARLERSKTALSNAQNVKQAIKDSFEASAKSVSGLIGLKVA